MGLLEEMAKAEAKFNATIDTIMLGNVLDTTKAAIQESVEENVYQAYPDPVVYQRRKDKNGGLQDKSVMDEKYDAAEHKLEVADNSRDNRTGRLVGEVVESGVGYDYWKGAFPRPFMKEAEEIMEKQNLFEDALRYGLQKAGYIVK